MHRRFAVMVIILGLAAGILGRAGAPGGAEDSGRRPGSEENAVSPVSRDYFRSPEFTVPLLAMELQYYRVPKDRWDLLLRRMAQSHANTISTYVCWAWHEYEEGRFDFTGRTIPERDLVGFIKLAGKRGLKVVLKPGPFIDAELKAGGVPQWVFENHPEAVARRADGKPYLHGDSRMPRLSYLHPAYLELTGRYYRELGKALAEEQWPKGPIVAVQVDNETPGDGFLSADNYLQFNFKADYNDYYLRIVWPEWLKTRYGEISSLNAAYGTAYADFRQVPMPRRWENPPDARAFQVYVDLDRFAEWQYVEGLRRMTALLRQAGFAVPAYQDLLCMPWDLSGILGDVGGMADAVGGWIGNNIYAEIYRPWTVFVGNIAYKYNWDEYVHLAVWRMKLTAALSEPYPAFIPEITASQRFYFQAPIAWNADAVTVYVGHQVQPDNPAISPNRAWGMEACVTPQGGLRDCFWNAKNTYLFMTYAPAFRSDRERPDLAVGYTHEPEHAWNWEFKFNLNRPHTRPKLKKLQDLVKGTNTSERGQLLARTLIRRHLDFDVLHLDHLRPGQMERYKLIIIPAPPSGPWAVPGAGSPVLQKLNGDRFHLYLPAGTEDGLDVEALLREGLVRRRAWADSPEVDVIERAADGGPTVLSIVNRAGREFGGEVFFRSGSERLKAWVGRKAVGFAAVKDGRLLAAVIDHDRGNGGYEYGDEGVTFSGTFATVVIGPDYVLAGALDRGTVTLHSPFLRRPGRVVRLNMNGRAEEVPFTFVGGTLSFVFEPGVGEDRADLYIALGEFGSLEDVLGGYLRRTAGE